MPSNSEDFERFIAQELKAASNSIKEAEDQLSEIKEMRPESGAINRALHKLRGENHFKEIWIQAFQKGQR